MALQLSGFGLLSAFGFRASGLHLCAHGMVVLGRYAHMLAAGKKPFDPSWRVGYIAGVNDNLNLLLSSALLLCRAAVGL
jgi:hypothetical protein